MYCGLPYGPPALFSADVLWENPLAYLCILPIAGLSIFCFVVFAKVSFADISADVATQRRARWLFQATSLAIFGAFLLLGLFAAYSLALVTWTDKQIEVLNIQTKLNANCLIDKAYVHSQEQLTDQAYALGYHLLIGAGICFAFGILLAVTCYLIYWRPSKRMSQSLPVSEGIAPQGE